MLNYYLVEIRLLIENNLDLKYDRKKNLLNKNYQYRYFYLRMCN